MEVKKIPYAKLTKERIYAGPISKDKPFKGGSDDDGGKKGKKSGSFKEVPFKYDHSTEDGKHDFHPIRIIGPVMYSHSGLMEKEDAAGRIEYSVMVNLSDTPEYRVFEDKMMNELHRGCYDALLKVPGFDIYEDVPYEDLIDPKKIKKNKYAFHAPIYTWREEDKVTPQKGREKSFFAKAFHVNDGYKSRFLRLVKKLDKDGNQVVKNGKPQYGYEELKWSKIMNCPIKFQPLIELRPFHIGTANSFKITTSEFIVLELKPRNSASVQEEIIQEIAEAMSPDDFEAMNENFEKAMLHNETVELKEKEEKSAKNGGNKSAANGKKSGKATVTRDDDDSDDDSAGADTSFLPKNRAESDDSDTEDKTEILKKKKEKSNGTSASKTAKSEKSEDSPKKEDPKKEKKKVDDFYEENPQPSKKEGKEKDVGAVKEKESAKEEKEVKDSTKEKKEGKEGKSKTKIVNRV